MIELLWVITILRKKNGLAVKRVIEGMLDMISYLLRRICNLWKSKIVHSKTWNFLINEKKKEEEVSFKRALKK